MINQSLHIILRNKLKNSLMILQFSLSFVALLLLIKEAYYNFENLTMNMGYETKGLIGGSISNVWGRVNSEEEFDKLYGELRNSLSEIKALPSVKSAGYMTYYPYAGSNSNSNGFQVNWVTPEALEALALRPVAGQQFNTSLEYDTKTYIMVNNNAYRDLQKFDPEPVGKGFNALVNTGEADFEIKPEDELYIAGVFEEFLMLGRYRTKRDFCRIMLVPYENKEKYRDKWGDIGFLSNFIVRLNPGADEMSAMQEIDNIFKKNISGRSVSLTSIESSDKQASRAPLIRLGIYFFICLVLTYVIVVGIIGITRENVTKRILEIGIRAALGSTEKQISKQFFGELTLIAIVSATLSLAVILILNLANNAQISVGVIEPIVAFIVLMTIIIGCVYNMITKTSRMRPNVSLYYE